MVHDHCLLFGFRLDFHTHTTPTHDFSYSFFQYIISCFFTRKLLFATCSLSLRSHLDLYRPLPACCFSYADLVLLRNLQPTHAYRETSYAVSPETRTHGYTPDTTDTRLAHAHALLYDTLSRDIHPVFFHISKSGQPRAPVLT